MFRQLLPISALLLGCGLMYLGGGVNGLILPVRGASEGFSAFSLGLLGTGYALGYVAGCMVTPTMVATVGHIRTFSVMSALAAISILASLLFLSPWAWVPLRAISGFCFAGGAMIVEGWLNERTDPKSRGTVFGVYIMVTLGATTAGQMILALGETTGHVFFVLGAMFYCLALVPTATSTSPTPRPLVSVKLDVPGLWRNSPIAVMSVFLVGISNTAFGSLGAVYADRIGLLLTSIALFVSLPVLAGAAAQIPIGMLSDRMDRRKVLVGVAFVAVFTDLAFIFLHPTDPWINLALSCVFGAAIYSMYPVIVSHANDHASADAYVQTSGGLLMIFGLGSITGPLIAGASMSLFNESGLFFTSLASHVAMIAFATWRIFARAAVKQEDKGTFVIAQARMSTPETAALAAKAAEPAADAR